MKIAIATDHAGFEFKENLKAFLLDKGYEVEDFGAFEFNKDDDYPDFIGKAAKYVSDNNCFGIVLGKSGAGEAIVANKYSNIRAVLGVNEENVKLARQHNDANVLSLGSSLTPLEQSKALITLFLETPFSNEERHVRRLNKIKEIENGQE